MPARPVAVIAGTKVARQKLLCRSSSLRGDQLAPAQAAEAGEQDDDAAARGGIGECVDVGDGQQRSLGWLLVASTLDPARVAADQAVLDGGGEDGLKQPVGLSGRDWADALIAGPAFCQAGMAAGRYYGTMVQSWLAEGPWLRVRSAGGRTWAF
jgi:hypothetical protein